MASRRHFLRLSAAVPLAAGVSAAVALALEPRRAHACSCHGYGRSRVLPEAGVTGVDPRTTLAFETFGYAAMSAEARDSFRYWLEDEHGDRTELGRERLGTLVWLTPTRTLAPDTEYELRTELRDDALLSRADPDESLTRFRTGQQRSLPPMPEPKLRRVRRRPPLLNSSWCAGRSYQAELLLEPPAIAPADAGLFRWELAYWDRRADEWRPIQGAPVRTSPYRDTPVTPTESITVGRSQCGQAPVFPLRARRVQLSLVRVDGERRAITRRFR